MINKEKGKISIPWIITIVFVVWMLFTFVILPNLNMIRLTLFNSGKLDLTPLSKVLASSRVKQTLKNTILISTLVAITTNIIGIFQILVLDYFDIKGRRILNVLYHLPIVINGLVLVLSYNFIIGTKGILTTNLQNLTPQLSNDWFVGLPAVLLQLTFSNTMYHITFVRSALNSIDYQTIEAAKNMGSSTPRILRKVVIPTILPAIFAATILNFSMGLNTFASSKILGGTKFETINPLVYIFSQSQNTKNYAVVLSSLLALVTIIVLVIFNYVEKRKNFTSISKTKTKLVREKINKKSTNAIVTLIAHLIAIIQLIPVIFIVIFSFMPYDDMIRGKINFANFNLDNYKQVFGSSLGMKPILVSVSYAALASIISVIIMIIFSRWITKYKNKYTSILESVVMIPWFVPSTLIALGLLFTFNSSKNIFVFNKVIAGTLYLMLISYIVRRSPINFRVIKQAFVSFNDELEEASRNLGASTFKTMIKVILPAMKSTILSALLLSFIGLFAEFNMSVFLFHPLFMPLGVVINNATNAEASPSAIMLSFVYAVVIMLFSSLVTFLTSYKGNESK